MLHFLLSNKLKQVLCKLDEADHLAVQEITILVHIFLWHPLNRQLNILYEPKESKLHSSLKIKWIKHNELNFSIKKRKK